MQLQDADANEFLDLKPIFKNDKVAEDIFTKHSNSITFALSPIFYLWKSLNNIPPDIASRQRRICDTDEKFNSRGIEYKH